jgi:hypothetical protein
MNLNTITFALVETRPTKCILKKEENSQKNNATQKNK